MTQPESMTCLLCGQKADELCPDGDCRACHKSLTFEDCCTGTYSARNLLRLGHSREAVLELYPNAKI